MGVVIAKACCDDEEGGATEDTGLDEVEPRQRVAARSFGKDVELKFMVLERKGQNKKD